jgi:hypothetical protein
MENQFNQLYQLGLLKFNKGRSNAHIELDMKKTPEVIFVIANYNPRSSKLETIFRDPEIEKYSKTKQFRLRFYVASYAGYGLHKDCACARDIWCIGIGREV